MIDRIESLKKRFENVEESLSDPKTMGDMKLFAQLNREYKELKEIVEVGQEYKQAVQNISAAKEIIETESDKDLLEMAQEEWTESEKRKNELEEKIKYYTNETLKIEDLNISSELFNSIFHICQYLFEYDENLFEYYKTHTYINTMNYKKEKLIESVLKEETENILFNCHIIQ